jgi:hypothetical protein
MELAVLLVLAMLRLTSHQMELKLLPYVNDCKLVLDKLRKYCNEVT